MLYTSSWSIFELTTSALIYNDWIGSCESNYHTITITTTPYDYNYNNTLKHQWNKDQYSIYYDGRRVWQSYNSKCRIVHKKYFSISIATYWITLWHLKSFLHCVAKYRIAITFTWHCTKHWFHAFLLKPVLIFVFHCFLFHWVIKWKAKNYQMSLKIQYQNGRKRQWQVSKWLLFNIKGATYSFFAENGVIVRNLNYRPWQWV